MTILSNYPGGFRGGVNIRGWPLFEAQAGNVWWVNSATGSNGNTGKTRERALATVDYAIGKCTANNGDVIMVMPNHAETITGVGGITADVAGITIIGMGSYNQRPRFLMDGATTVTFVVSAADVTVQNLVFAGGHNGIVRCFNITAAGFKAIDVEFEDNTTDEHFLVAFDFSSTVDETSSGATIVGCKWTTIDAGVTDFISFAADVTNLTVLDNFFCADAATGAGLILCATGKDIRGLNCQRNVLICGNTTTDLLIDNDTAVNTGIAAHNRIGHHDTAAAILIDCDGIRLFDNLSTAIDTGSGFVLPAIDTDT